MTTFTDLFCRIIFLFLVYQPRYKCKVGLSVITIENCRPQMKSCIFEIMIYFHGKCICSNRLVLLHSILLECIGANWNSCGILILTENCKRILIFKFNMKQIFNIRNCCPFWQKLKVQKNQRSFWHRLQNKDLHFNTLPNQVIEKLINCDKNRGS